MQPTESEMLWAKESHSFVHDQYEAFKDYLIHTEQRREQSVSLYFGLLAAILAVAGALWTSSGLAASYQLILASVNFGIGVYTFGLMLFYRHTAFEFRLEMDKITLRWATHRTDDVAYFHLPLSNQYVHRATVARPAPSSGCQPANRILTRMRSGGHMLGWLWNSEKDALFILSLNSFSALAIGLFVSQWVLTSVHGLATPVWLLLLALPYVVGTVAWVLQASFYVRQYQRLLQRAQDELQKVATDLQRGQSIDDSLATDQQAHTYSQHER